MSKNPLSVYKAADPSIRSGLYTTEFMISVLMLILASVLLFLGSIDQDTWKWIAGPIAAAYAVSRGLAKS